MNDIMLKKQYFSEKLAGSAFMLSFGAAISIVAFPVVLPWILGSIAIVLAVLSKGGNMKMGLRARRACLISTIVIVISVLILVFSVMVFLYALQDPQMREELSGVMYRMYGYTLDEFLKTVGWNL